MDRHHDESIMHKRIMKKQTRRNLSFTAFVFLIVFAPIAYGFDTKANTALVIDNLTNTILLEKNSTKRIPPASMSKLMTLYMVFDALRDKRILMTDIIQVSKTASEKGGSKMFLNEGQDVSIEDIVKGIIIHSGNDACIAIAEVLSGTEKEFALNMNTKAKKIGLTNSYFTNSTGWPDKNHYMSAKDLVHLAKKIRIEFPDYYKFFSDESFTWNGITQKNRNPLLQKGLGADGLKTGHTEEAGYGLVGSAKRGNRRVTFVISGLNSSKERAIEAEKITNWVYRDFIAKRVAQKNKIIGRMPVWLGEKSDVALYVKEDLYILTPVMSSANVKATISYNRAIEAPFEAGAPTPAKMKVTIETKTDDKLDSFNREFNLFAFEESNSGNFFTRFKAATTILINSIKRILK